MAPHSIVKLQNNQNFSGLANINCMFLCNGKILAWMELVKLASDDRISLFSWNIEDNS